MKGDLNDLSRCRIARMAGLLYLAYIATVIVSSFIQGKPIVWGDAATTAKAIQAAQGMFRLGVALELIAALLFLLTAWSLYVLFKPVSQSLALLFLLLNVVGVAIECVCTLLHFTALLFSDGSGYLRVVQPDQLHALALLFLQISKSGNMVTVLFYGAWVFPLGYLALKSRLLPKVFGILLMLDSVALMICFVQLWFFPDYERWTYPLYPVMFIAECGFGLWLAIKAVKNSGPTPIATA
jgi:hypothetical protein